MNYVGNEKTLPVLYEMTVLSRAVRKRIAQDFEFMDLVCTQISDGILLMALEVPNQQRGKSETEHDAFTYLCRNIQFLTFLAGENPKLWFKHISARERSELLPLVYGGEITMENDWRPGSLLQRVQELISVPDRKSKDTGDKVIWKLWDQLMLDNYLLLSYCFPDVVSGYLKDDPNGQTATQWLKSGMKKVGGKAAATACDQCGDTRESRKLMRCGKCKVAWYVRTVGARFRFRLSCY